MGYKTKTTTQRVMRAHLHEINEMEEDGWAVRQVVPVYEGGTVGKYAHSATNEFIVVYERGFYDGRT